MDSEKLNSKIRNHLKVMVQALENVHCDRSLQKTELSSWVQDAIHSLNVLKTNGNRLYIIGNGASSSMASHFATDYTKNASIKSFSCNDGALLTTFSNDYSYETAYQRILEQYTCAGDMLICISSSGESKNILNAARTFKEMDISNQVITFSGFNFENSLRKIGDFNLFIDASEYGYVESCHAYYLHLMIDIYIDSYCKESDH